MASLVDGGRQRMRLVGMSDAQIARVESIGKVEPRITIVAPIAGAIAELGVREGSAVTTGSPIVRINGLSTVWINAELPEALAAQLKSGDRVEAKAPDGSVVMGTVGALLPEVNAQTRTLKVRVEVDNAQRKLLPGMFATLNFKPSARDNMLLIPSEAVIATGTRNIVMVAEGGGRFTPVQIEPGVESGGQTEIKKGLKAGQRVVLSGQFLLDSEASLTRTLVNRGDVAPADAAPPAKEAPRFQGTGKVDSIDKDEVTLSHGPIPALKWNAMTMGFQAPAKGVPKDIVVGSTVDFEIQPMDDGQYRIVSIRPHPTSKATP
ncbi:MAG: efflux RND transporter periplasmic adaptor subunit [Usitatibacter sp.]